MSAANTPATSATLTPRLDPYYKAASTPASAPVAAGRSPPQSRRAGLNGPRKRFAPPSFGTKRPSLSLTAALNGTLALKKTRKVRTLDESKPTSWFFDIFEEKQEQQEYRMSEWTMTQSATILDISDDESKANAKAERGKENIDPNEVSIPITRLMAAAKAAAPVAPQDVAPEEARSALNDLNPANYYAEGLDASSVLLVDVEAEESRLDEVNKQAASVVARVPTQQPARAFNLESLGATSEVESESNAAQIRALLMAVSPVWDNSEPRLGEESTAEPPETCSSLDMEIWESGSARDENESQTEDSVVALQEA